MTSSRRVFLSSVAGASGSLRPAGAAARRSGIAAGAHLAHGRGGREKIKITDVKVISLGYRLKPEEEWPDGDNNVII